jgi:hypothetical protein
MYYDGYKIAAPREKASQSRGNKMAAPPEQQREQTRAMSDEAEIKMI